MKVSSWLRQYQLTGEVPEGENAEFAFWCGWLIAHAGRASQTATTFDEQRSMAIKAAEFIEEQK